MKRKPFPHDASNLRLDIFIMWQEKILCGIFLGLHKCCICLLILQIWLWKPNWTRLKIFSLECDIKSFLIQIYTWKKRMERKNNNKNKYNVLLGQWFPLRHIILQSSSSVVWHLNFIHLSKSFVCLK